MTLDLDELCEKVHEHVRMGGFSAPDEWVVDCPPSTVLALIERVRLAEQRQARGPVTVGMYTPTGFEPYPGHDACGMDFDTWAELTRKRIAENA